jgi:hypothetical protein
MLILFLIGNNRNLHTLKRINCEVEASASVYFSFYGIVGRT